MNNYIPLRRGQTWSSQLTFWQETQGGAVIDLTGANLTFNRNEFPSGPTLAISDAPGGKAILSLSVADTNALVLNETYSIQLKLVVGVETRIYPELRFAVVP